MNPEAQQQRREMAVMCRGFTLIEIIAVVVLLGLLMTVAAPIVSGGIQASKLTTSGTQVLAALNEAREIAMTLNADVELRIYEAVDSGLPGSPASWNTVGIYVLQPTSDESDQDSSKEVFKAAVPPVKLESGVEIHPARQFTSLLEIKPKTPKDENPAYRRYVAFRFRPDGSTDLTPGRLWHLTVVPDTGGRKDTLPANFFTIQVEPVTGRARTFRP